VASPGQRGLAGACWGGAGVASVLWGGLGVERLIVAAGGGSGVEGAGRPSSAISMTSSQLEWLSARSCSEGGGPRFA